MHGLCRLGRSRRPEYIERFNNDFRRFASDIVGMTALADRVLLANSRRTAESEEIWEFEKKGL